MEFDSEAVASNGTDDLISVNVSAVDPVEADYKNGDLQSSDLTTKKTLIIMYG